MKPKEPPIWTGERFEIWRNAAEKWSESNESPEDKYEEIVTEMETLGLVTEMRRYAMNAMFIDKLEESGKIKAMEKLRLKDIVQSADGEK